MLCDAESSFIPKGEVLWNRPYSCTLNRIVKACIALSLLAYS